MSESRRDLDALTRALLRGRLVRVAAAVAAVFTVVRLADVWAIATPRHRWAASALALALVALTITAQGLERPFERHARSGRSVVLALVGWGVLAPLALWSMQLLHLALIAAPFTVAWWLARGVGTAPLLAAGWFAGALAHDLWALAPLPAVAILLRRRPAAAFAAVLVTGALLRCAFTLALPTPIWSPDSWGWVRLAFQLLDGSGLGWEAATGVPAGHMHGLGRPPHVAAVMLGSLWAGGNELLFVVFMHLVGLVTAWWVSLELRRRLGDLAGWQACAALALSPELLHYEHSVLSESLLVALMCVTLALLLRVRRGEDATWSDAVALGVTSGALATVRSVATLTPAVVVLAAIAARWPRRRVAALAASGAAPMLVVASIHLAADGSFGLSSPLYRSYVWFSVTAHQLDLDAPLHAPIKAEMRGALTSHDARRPPWDPDVEWILFGADGPLQGSATLTALPLAERSRVLNELAWEGLSRDVAGFVRRAAYQVGVNYLLAPPWWSDAYFPPWHDLVTRWSPWAALPPRFERLRAAPAPLGHLRGERTYRWVEEVVRLLNGGVGSTLYGTQPFSAYKSPWLALGLLLVIWRRPALRSCRVPALAVAATGALMIAITCAVHSPFPRYRLPMYPVGVLLAALALADRPRPDGVP